MEPSLLVPTSSSGGLVLAASGPRGARRGPAPHGQGTGDTDEPGEIVALRDLDGDDPADALTRARARTIASRLALSRPRHDPAAPRGVGDLSSTPFRGVSDDIDLDRTLDVLATTPHPAEHEIVVRERRRTRRSVVLLVDVSGSMRGERVQTAAAAVGALTGELARDRLAVVAFWAQAALLVRLDEPTSPLGVLDRLLRVPARGLTNVTFALEVAARALAGTPVHQARTILLSDCVHNAGPDPRTVAGRLPRLDVLLDATGETDVALGRELAHLGRGRFRTLRTYRDVAPALGSIFAR